MFAKWQTRGRLKLGGQEACAVFYGPPLLYHPEMAPLSEFGVPLSGSYITGFSFMFKDGILRYTLLCHPPFQNSGQH